VSSGVISPFAVAATHREEVQQVRKDALEAKQLAVAAAQRQQPLSRFRTAP